MLVVGARLRGNETLKDTLRLPRPLLQIDADPQAHGRGYSADHFLVGDAKLALAGLAARLKSRLKVAAGFGAAIATARTEAEAQLRKGLGPYEQLVDAQIGRAHV